jgi:hypothetical protein
MSYRVKKVNIDLNIRSAHVENVTTPMNVKVLWVRGGNKNMDTKTKQLSSEKTDAVFNEKFQMVSQLDWDGIKFAPKKYDMQLWKADQTQMLGVGDFDLGKYANMQEGVEHVDKLPLRSCPFDQQAYIEVILKVKQEGDTPKSGSSGSSRNRALSGKNSMNKSII